ncbi:hypothetical protein WH52_00780 [Tenacibaculum holothuriorum]|uniref:Outer membrane protein beta-barrel domain-containing protein n=2 Tax=Tenacibaculum holothuriorum TaxID=1635173 RepID=A0A1Y2PIF1_9FLAO|nr:hypothetical protein WH52_00780 [Tenacibaculum holothuriorum]
MAVGLTVTAQETNFGVIGGFNMTSISTTDSSAGIPLTLSVNGSGFFAGFFVDFEVSDKFSIQPELTYSAGFKNGDSVNSITMPILAKFYVSDKFSLQAGPMLDLVVDETPQEANNFGLGLAGGIGYDVDENVLIVFRYSLGLTNRVNLNNISQKVDYLQIGVGYKF